MKISKLMRELAKLRVLHGDIEVVVHDDIGFEAPQPYYEADKTSVIYGKIVM